MLRVDHTLISDDVISVQFCCDLSQCKGACCVKGDAGAPLEEEEISLIEDHFDEISKYMMPEGKEEINRIGVFDYDADGKFVTPLIKGNECAFVFPEAGIARCAIEQAFQDKKIPFAKPLSCHLYPIRIKRMKVNEAVNYHQWDICAKALENGKKQKMPLYVFLKEALIRKYGGSWYNRLVRLLSLSL